MSRLLSALFLLGLLSLPLAACNTGYSCNPEDCGDAIADERPTDTASAAAAESAEEAQ